MLWLVIWPRIHTNTRAIQTHHYERWGGHAYPVPAIMACTCLPCHLCLLIVSLSYIERELQRCGFLTDCACACVSVNMYWRDWCQIYSVLHSPFQHAFKYFRWLALSRKRGYKNMAIKLIRFYSVQAVHILSLVYTIQFNSVLFI